MKALLVGVLTLFASLAMAANQTYDLNFDLSVEGKRMSSMGIIAMAGQKAVISEEVDGETRFIEVVANEGQVSGHKGILMNIVVGRIGKDGKREILARPQVLADSGKTATVSVGETDGAEVVKLSVLAKRRAL